jgi:anti-sigma-K factor RskA
MKDETYIDLITGYLQGTLSADDNERLEKLIEEGRIDYSEIERIEKIWHDVGSLDLPEPGSRMKQRFYEMLENEKVRNQQNLKTLFHFNPDWMIRAAAALILLLAGFSAGLIFGTSSDAEKQVLAVQEEVEQIKNALVYHAYQQTSASERIQAVGLATRIDKADDQLLMILIHTMNNDPNVNVRLASIDALRKYADQRGVRGAFVQALAVQDNPFVQLSLIDTLVELNERSAAGEMEKLLLADNTEPEVRERLMEGIAELRI